MAIIGIVPAALVRREGRLDAEHYLGSGDAEQEREDNDAAERQGPLPGVTVIKKDGE